MKTGQIINRVRSLIDDNVEPYRWTDEDLVEYLNDSIEEICIELPLLTDSTNVTSPNAICSIPIVASTSKYSLDARVVKVLDAYFDATDLSSTNYKMIIGSSYVLDEYESNWKAYSSASPPRYIIDDIDYGCIKLVPTPSKAGTLSMRVWRLPLTRLNITSFDNEPEINQRFHRHLIDGVISKAYLKMDSETYHPKKAMEHEQRWLNNISKFKKSYILEHSRDEVIGLSEVYF